MPLPQNIKAAELSLALSWGYAELPEVIEWADEQISQSDTPNETLFDLSLAKGTGEAAGFLRVISEGADKWLSLSYFLNRFYTAKSLDPGTASTLAKQLYDCTMNDDAPEVFRSFASHWDAIDLAIDGIAGSPEECIQDFLRDIRKAVMWNGGPNFEALRN